MNWKSIILTALITGLVTLGTGMLLFWWQSEKAELTYNSIKSIPFDEAVDSLFIQQVEITNTGDKTIDDVVVVMSLDEGSIERFRINIDRAIPHQQDISENVITLQVNSLNPAEGASISVLFRTQHPNSDGAKLSVRGKGVTGQPLGGTQESRREPIAIALISAYVGILAFIMSTKRGRHLLPIVVKSLMLRRPLPGDQRYQIASALSLYGYPEKAKEYLASGASRQYWVETDLLAAEALKEDEKVIRDMIEIFRYISDLPNIAPTSKAITYYNISRLHSSLNSQDDAASQYMEKARKLDAAEIEGRLARDPVFLGKEI